MSMLINLIEILSVIVLFVLLGVRLYLKRREIKVKKVIIFEYSEKYRQKINELVNAHPKIFKVLGLMSLISAPILTIIGVYYLLNSLISFKPTVALVLPSVSNFRYPGPVISVPFWMWIIAIFIIVFSHESMHALIAASEGVRTRKYGLLYFLILPIGAFVDIDEKKLKKLSLKNKVKIFAAGSFGNLLVFIFVLILLIAFSNAINMLLESRGVWFNTTAPGSPAENVKLKGVIVKIDNITINNIYDLQEFLRSAKPNTTVAIETTEGKYNLTLAEKDNVSYIGIVGARNYIVYKGSNVAVPESLILLINYFFITFQWIAFLSIGIAIANMLPILPLDGGLIVKEILKEKYGEKGEKISRFVSLIFLILLLSSLFLSSLTRQVVS